MRVDRDLVRTIEWSSARATALHAEALARTSPASGSTVEWFDGGALVSLGAGRYVNRAVGVGLGDASATEWFDALEGFYGARSMPAKAEVSPWVTSDFLAESRARGYSIEWFRNVFARELDALPTRSPVAEIAEVDDATYEAWREILSNEATPGSPERAVADEFCDARHQVQGAVDLVLSDRGAVVATGSLLVVDGIAWLGGAATRTSARGHGFQSALIADRLHRAREGGADLAAVTALADGPSSRNLHALGFQLLYTQVVLTR
jgi:GNAT superfamily N-acetyltransferase